MELTKSISNWVQPILGTTPSCGLGLVMILRNTSYFVFEFPPKHVYILQFIVKCECTWVLSTVAGSAQSALQQVLTK